MASLTKPGVKPIPPGARSNNKAILVLLGLTGAGKTTTLNYLFDRQNITRTDSYCSATSTIMEYSASINAEGDDYDLKVIDTPGFGDTRQTAQVRDARFVATFDNLLRTHEDMKSCYPTMVLLVAKFNDDRIDGETSHFIQMLKAVDKLLSNYRLIDKERPNLIFVLTHVMSESNMQVRKDPRPKVQLIECLVKTFTKIPTPIQVVMAENKPELYDLPVLNDNHKLPNGEYYPLNLLKKIQEVAVKADDVVGETIIREAYKNPSLIQMQLQKEIELLPEGNMIVNQTLRMLKDAKFSIENNQMSREIKRLWDLLDEEERKPFFNSLQITQKTFHDHKIVGEDDIPCTIEGVLKLLLDLPLNPPVVSVLEKMGIVAPELPSSAQGVGHFYNIFTDSIMANTPFNLTALDYTETGFRAPAGIRGQVINETLFLNSIFENSVKYYEDRLKQLNITDDYILENFTSTPKTGYNIVVSGKNPTKLTGVRETRVFKMHLKKATISASYRSSVAKLSVKFDPCDTQPWHAFFLANGTHVVKSLYAGGCVEVVAVRKDENTPLGPKANVEAVMTCISDMLSNLGCFRPMDLSAVTDDWDFQVSFRGGDQTLDKPMISNLFNLRGKTFVKKWTESLAIYPAMLHSEIELECVTQYLRKTNSSAAREIGKAIKSLFVTPDKEEDDSAPQFVPPPLSIQKQNQILKEVIETFQENDRAEGVPERHNVPEPDVKPTPKQPLGWRVWFRQKLRAT